MEVDPRSPERGQYGFVQSLIREVAYGTLSRRDRRTRHLAAARYFETLGDEELAGALATHYLAAHEASAEGPERDAVGAQARLALRAAGERAAALGAHEQAVTFLTQALEVTTEPVDRAALLVSLADSANPSGMHELAESSARDALALYQAAGAEDAAMHAAAVLGRILIDVGKLHEAGPALEHALLQRGKSGDDEASAAVLASLARIYMRLNENERAVAAADRALLAAELVDARTTIAEALVNKGTALGGLGRTFEGRVLLQAGVDLAAELGIIELRLRGLNNLGAAWMEDDPKRSLDTVMASIEIADLMGQAGIGNWQIGAAAMYQLSMGEDWARPVAMLEEMLSSAVTPHDVARGLAGLALFKVMQGKDARGALDAARAAAVGVDEVQMSAAINWAEALLAYSEGDYGAAMTPG